MQSICDHEQAKQLGAFIKQKYFKEDKHPYENILELTMEVFRQKNGVCEVSETALGMTEILIEILALLSNPKISSLLSKRAQENSGAYLKTLVSYFNMIEICEQDIQRSMDYLLLSRYYGGLSNEKFIELKEFYESDQAA